MSMVERCGQKEDVFPCGHAIKAFSSSTLSLVVPGYHEPLGSFYSGWLSSAFTIGNILSSYGWGQFADRFGRKPVVIICVCFICACSVALGLSTSYALAIAIMISLGLGDCLTPTIRIMIAEILGPSKAVIGMALLPGCQSIGNIIGPAIGGLLAQPDVSRFSSFPPMVIFARYPFLLPNLVVAVLAFASLPLIIIGVKETLMKHENVLRESLPSSAGEEEHSNIGIRGVNLDTEGSVKSAVVNGNSHSHVRVNSIGGGLDLEERTSLIEGAALLDGAYYFEDQDEFPPLRHPDAHASISWFGSKGLMASSHVRSLFCLELLVLAIRIGFLQMYPLWLLASAENGGLEWELPKIGVVMACSGVGGMIFQFIVYPVLCQTVGIVKLLRIFGAAAVLAFLLIPDLQHLSWSKGHSYLVGITLLVLVESFTSVYETATTVAMANAVPAHMRGQLSALVGVGGALGRIAGPASLSNLLAWSLSYSSAKYGWLVDYHLVFVIESIVMVIVVLLGFHALTLASLTTPVE